MSSSSESVLDHIADYLTFISDAQFFWFMLNTSYNHGCNLTSKFLSGGDCGKVGGCGGGGGVGIGIGVGIGVGGGGGSGGDNSGSG
jgi:hypothetical protein